MLDLNKYIVKTDHNKPFHTSSYAQVANGNKLGATSTISFEKRQQIEKNRQKISNYRQSLIGNSYNSIRPKSVETISDTGRPPSQRRPNEVPKLKPRPYDPYQ